MSKFFVTSTVYVFLSVLSHTCINTTLLKGSKSYEQSTFVFNYNSSQHAIMCLFKTLSYYLVIETSDIDI